MNLLALLTNHHHYWGIPHARQSDQHLIQICYECGNEREIKIDLHPFRRQSDVEGERVDTRAVWEDT